MLLSARDIMLGTWPPIWFCMSLQDLFDWAWVRVMSTLWFHVAHIRHKTAAHHGPVTVSVQLSAADSDSVSSLSMT